MSVETMNPEKCSRCGAEVNLLGRSIDGGFHPGGKYCVDAIEEEAAS